MNECNVCYDKPAVVNCFGSCSIKICLNCFNTMLKLNVCKDVEFCCPQCRLTSIKNKDRRFTTFLNSNKSTLKRVITLYETNNLNTAWSTWVNPVIPDISYSIYHNELIHLTSEQLAELTYIGTHDYTDSDDALPD
jgi:hypothetical protein